MFTDRIQTTLIALFATTALSACTTESLNRIGDWMAEAESSLFPEAQAAPAPERPTQPVYGPVAALTPEELEAAKAVVAENGADADELDFAGLMALAMLLSGELEHVPMQVLPDGSIVFAQVSHGVPVQGYPGQGVPMQGYPMQQGVPMQGYPQGFGMPGYPQQGFGQAGAAANPGWADAGSAWYPNVQYDPYEYRNPESSYYDPYEVDSEGWGGGASENPSSSYYDSGSFSGGFDSYD